VKTHDEATRSQESVEPVEPAYYDDSATIYLADCLTTLSRLPAESVHAVVTDPPYAIASNSAATDQFRSSTTGTCTGCLTEPTVQGWELCAACLETVQRQALMGAPMLGMQSANWHEKATHSRGYADNNNRDFQRWCELWTAECLRVLKPGGHFIAFGGTRTWHRLAIAAEDAGFTIRDSLAWLYGTGFPKSPDVGQAVDALLAETGASGDPNSQFGLWTGWRTTLKPGFEPIVFARKPFDETVAGNIVTNGTGALNIPGCTIADATDTASPIGRWPTNVMLDLSQANALDRDAGEPVSRYFWVAKPTQGERVVVDGISHPTVKPLTLMRQLVKLVTHEGDTVLEPFAGSGTTVEACLLEKRKVIAIERDEAYLPLIKHRIDRRLDPLAAARRNDAADVVDLFA